MRADKIAPATPPGRAVMLRRIEVAGWTGRAVAAAVAVSERIVRQWLARYRAGGVSGLEDSCNRAQVVANKPAAPWLAMSLQLRDCRLTAAEIAALPSLARTTIAGDLAAAGLGRSQALASKPPVVRYQRERPGELAHLDGKKLARFGRVGHQGQEAFDPIAERDAVRRSRRRITGSRRGGVVPWAGTSSTSPSATFSRRKSGPPLPAAWFGRCAGAATAVSASRAS